MERTRRRWLRYAGGIGLTATAGCIGNLQETRPRDTGGLGVSVASTDGEIDFPVQPGVELVRDTATAEHPPRLRTTLENTGDETVRVGEGRAVHFEHVRADSGLLTLLPARSPSEYPAEADCWRLSDEVAVSEEYRTFEIEAGESSRREIDLYATTDADGCLPVGEHRFETTISVLAADGETEAASDWGFTVLLE